MKVFISWSGDRSRAVAQALFDWLQCVYQTCSLWMSGSSLQPGSRWSSELAKALEETELGILCLTKENLNSPWIVFEAGALSKSVAEGRTVPFLIDLEPADLDGPLSQFQAVRATMEGTRRLVKMRAEVNPANVQSEEAIERVFRVWWPELEKEFESLKHDKESREASHTESA